MKKVLIIIFLLIASRPAYAEVIYKWVDKDGVVGFTDDRNLIPASSRRVAEIKEDLTETRSRGQEAASPRRTQGRTTDLYGRDETRWREKVRPWRELLEEATSNYEKTQEELVKQGEGLVWNRFTGKTQYQMISNKLQAITQRLEGYRAQIAEAERMLGELLKEAEMAEANPEWLEPGIPRPVRKVPTLKKAEAETDLYGRDETWWREKVRPWKEQLRESIEKYGEAEREFARRAEGLGPFKWGRLSLTQYQMISSRQVASNDQMEKYRAQIVEANEMLKKLSQEAEETKANPDWLR